MFLRSYIVLHFWIFESHKTKTSRCCVCFERSYDI